MRRTHCEELIAKNSLRRTHYEEPKSEWAKAPKAVILSRFNLPWIAKAGIGKDFLLLAWQAVAGAITLQPIKGGWRLCGRSTVDSLSPTSKQQL